MPVRLSRKRAATARCSLRERAITVLELLYTFRLLTTHHVRRLQGYEDTINDRQRVGHLMRGLLRYKLVRQLKRVKGGRGGGSEPGVYALAHAGRTFLDRIRPLKHPRPAWEISTRFQRHRLSGSELYVQLVELVRESQGEKYLAQRASLETFSGEPKAWRHFTGMGGELVRLKPDAYVRLRIGKWVLRAFVEIDLGTESLPTIRKKFERYLAYRASGVEQRRTRKIDGKPGIFPVVVLFVPDERRKQNIERVLAVFKGKARGLFVVGLLEEGAQVLLRVLDEKRARIEAKQGHGTKHTEKNGRAPP